MAKITDLGKWMITNGGNYDESTTYENLTLVFYNNSTYITTKEVTGITPSDDGVNYRLMAQGFDASALGEVIATDTQGLVGEPKSQVSAQTLIDAIAEKYSQLNDNLLDTDVVEDLIAEADKGNSSKKVVRTSSVTLNTPYTEGLTGAYKSGVAYINMDGTSFGTIMWFQMGSIGEEPIVFLKRKSNGTWGGWSKILTDTTNPTTYTVDTSLIPNYVSGSINITQLGKIVVVTLRDLKLSNQAVDTQVDNIVNIPKSNGLFYTAVGFSGNSVCGTLFIRNGSEAEKTQLTIRSISNKAIFATLMYFAE